MKVSSLILSWEVCPSVDHTADDSSLIVVVIPRFNRRHVLTVGPSSQQSPAIGNNNPYVARLSVAIKALAIGPASIFEPFAKMIDVDFLARSDNVIPANIANDEAIGFQIPSAKGRADNQ